MSALRFYLVALTCAAPAMAGVDLPNGQRVEAIDFERHVMGIFSKAGCNNGSCHGSFQGKNGFRLSLFGFDPDRDHAALTRELQGRRIDRADPDASLLLLKAAGLMKHDGGARFSKDSWQYQMLREWIRSGAQWSKGSGEIVRLDLSPREYVTVQVGEAVRIQVTATFADRSTEDVTALCDLRVQDDAVAKVSATGIVTGQQPGDSGFVALYRGQVAAARILVPVKAPTGGAYPKAVNFVDTEVHAKLQKLNVLPSEPTSDTEFLRRVTIDVTGALPTPDEVRAFLADSASDKRAKKIDELLSHPRHAALWATKLSDITGNNTQALENPPDMQVKRSQMWHDWLRDRVARNVPYDQFVRGILTATSRENMSAAEWLDHVKKVEADAAKFDTSAYVQRDTLDLFWRRQQVVPTTEWAEKTAAAFLGVRLECAQCHKHPTDRWTQADYRAFANLFAAVSFQNNQFSSPEFEKVIKAENAERTKANMGKPGNQQRQPLREMHVLAEPRRNLLAHPDTNRPLPPKAPGGPMFAVEKGKDVRAQLWEWMQRPDNPFFARSFVNRVWAHYFGVGLVDPVDDFSLANPPSNARLLDALAKDFVDHQYDIRHLERTILSSRTYQTSSVPNATNRFDKVNYARSYVRPMMAEVVVDILNDALGTTETFNFAAAKDDAGGKAMDGKRMTEVGSSRVQNGNLAYALRIFGRPARTSACDCERATGPALPQTLFRMTDPAVLQKLRAPNGRIATLVKNKSRPDGEVFEELFLACLSRKPRPDEVETFEQHRRSTKDRASMFADVTWALINTREFVLNH